MPLGPVNKGSSFNLGRSANSAGKPRRSRSRNVAHASAVTRSGTQSAIFQRKQATAAPLQPNPGSVPSHLRKPAGIPTDFRGASTRPSIKLKPCVLKSSLWDTPVATPSKPVSAQTSAPEVLPQDKSPAGLSTHLPRTAPTHPSRIPHVSSSLWDYHIS